MEPEQTSPAPEETTQEDKFTNLNKVTPLSKYLAMCLFVLLPFLGGWIGYTYAPEKVVEIERVLHADNRESLKSDTFSTKDNFVTYNNTKFNYSVDVPQLWSITALDFSCPPNESPDLYKHSVIGFTQGEDNRDCIGPTNIGTFSIEVYENEPLDIERLDPVGKVLSYSEEKTEINGHEVKYISGITMPPGETNPGIPFTTVIFEKDGLFYIVIDASGEVGEESTTLNTEFEEFLNSFRIFSGNEEGYREVESGAGESIKQEVIVNNPDDVTLCADNFEKDSLSATYDMTGWVESTGTYGMYFKTKHPSSFTIERGVSDDETTFEIKDTQSGLTAEVRVFDLETEIFSFIGMNRTVYTYETNSNTIWMRSNYNEVNKRCHTSESDYTNKGNLVFVHRAGFMGAWSTTYNIIMEPTPEQYEAYDGNRPVAVSISYSGDMNDPLYNNGAYKIFSNTIEQMVLEMELMPTGKG